MKILVLNYVETRIKTIRINARYKERRKSDPGCRKQAGRQTSDEDEAGEAVELL